MSKSILTVAMVCGLAVMLVGCGPKNRGTPGEYRPESRTNAERGLGSADLLAATDQAVQEIANLPDIRKQAGRTVIVMDTVENQTSDPTENFQIYLARIRAGLNQSGAKRDLAFIENRYKADAIKAREGLPPGEHGSTRIVPEYALTATFYDLPRGGTNFYLLTFQMVDLSSEIVTWEGSYEVKLAY